jgi:hypothetical protein
LCETKENRKEERKSAVQGGKGKESGEKGLKNTIPTPKTCLSQFMWN